MIKKKDPSYSSKWYRKLESVLLPTISGLLHLKASSKAWKILLFRSPNITIPEMKEDQIDIELSIFIAYCFDLICCYVFNIVPFSRCRKASDIAMHHLPILLFIQPLLVPALKDLVWLDPTFFNIIQNSPLGQVFAYKLTTAAALGFTSSLNEAMMCFQRAELNLQGRRSLEEGKSNDDCTKRTRINIFTGKSIQLLELCYKIYVFAISPIFSINAMFQADYILIQTQMNNTGIDDDDSSGSGFTSILLAYITSPCMLRSIIYRFFMIILYPNMAKKTYLRIKQLLFGKVKN